MTWEKARCPECNKVIDRWNGEPVSGDGSISFDEHGFVDLSDILFTVNFRCSNPECSFELEDASAEDLEEWFEEHKVEEGVEE